MKWYSNKVDFSSDDLVLATKRPGIQTSRGCPTEQQLGAPIDDVLRPIIPQVSAARIDILPTQTRACFEQDLLLRPVVLEDILYVIGRRVSSGRKGRKYALVCLKVAVVEGVIRVSRHVNDDERQVSGRIEDVDIHKSTFDEVGLRR